MLLIIIILVFVIIIDFVVTIGVTFAIVTIIIIVVIMNIFRASLTNLFKALLEKAPLRLQQTTTTINNSNN